MFRGKGGLKPIPLMVLALGAGPATAFPCAFSTECYEADACTGTSFAIEVDIDGKGISTDYGDLTVVAVKETGRLTTLFATGQGAEYLLSLTPQAARFTTHSNEGPLAITYLGTCEGAF
ncbi:hypothetical protein [Marimonas arenosa]|uniref:Uncharacterized protein n=1 Tax=Marimonas arenosa TaxID=1795305 RepID=A0AAE3W9X7_9RHOB|nr:hypothetical protein [Marimonas arenosa]MDQ2088598.1 hypothetical protein [Marimonas arenosa]